MLIEGVVACINLFDFPGAQVGCAHLTIVVAVVFVFECYGVILCLVRLPSPCMSDP